MFTSNDKAINYGKRSGLAELDGSHHDRPLQGPYKDITPPDDDALLRKSPTHHDAFRSLSNYEVDADPDLQRKVRFRPRKGANEDQSSLSSSADHGFGGFIFQGKKSCRTPPEILTPEAGDHPRGTQQAGPKQLLLQLRAALNEKELQLVELREQHMVVLKRCADARHSWEAALQGKDRVIVQLQRTLKHHKSHHDRQERENKENLHALQKRQTKQENAEVERKELKVALLEAKNAQLVQELVEQQKIITRMQRHIDEKEKSCVNHHQKLEKMNKRIQDLKSALHVKEEEVTKQAKECNKLKTRLWKRDSIIAQLQLSQQQLQSSIPHKEAAQEAQAMSHENVHFKENAAPNEKSLSGRENELGNKASHKDHLETREHCHQCEIGKLMELKDNFSNVHEGAVKDSNDEEGVMHRIQKRMRELQQSLRSKDMALSDRNNEYQEAVMEIRRLTEEHKAMKHECKELSRRNYQLESTVAHLQYPDMQMGANLVSEAPTPPVEVSQPNEFSQGVSTGEDLAFDDAMQDSMTEWEQLSNASVYHANFEKIKITEVEMPNIEQQQGIPQIQPPHSSFHSPLPMRTSMMNPTPPSPNVRPPFENKECPSAGPPIADVGPGLPSELEENYQSIQDEIKKREQCWRKTEEHMREVLFQQMKLLGESKSSSCHAKSPKAHSTLNHLHHLQAAARGDTTAHKHGSIWTPRRNPESRRSSQRSPHSPEVYVHHRHGHESGGHHHHRQASYEQELLDYELVDHRKVNHNVGRRRHHEHHDVGWKYGDEEMQNAKRMDYRRRGRVA